VETDHAKRDRLRERRKRRKKKTKPSSQAFPTAADNQRDTDIDQALQNVIGASMDEPEPTDVPNTTTDANVPQVEPSTNINNTPQASNVTNVVNTPHHDEDHANKTQVVDNNEDDVLTRTPPIDANRISSPEKHQDDGEPIML
jgi:hypothetical protein